MPVYEISESASTATGDLRSIVTVGCPEAPLPLAWRDPLSLADRGLSSYIAESSWVAPGAQVIGNVVMGELSSAWFNSVLRADGDR
jgi:hypothetical protein